MTVSRTRMRVGAMWARDMRAFGLVRGPVVATIDGEVLVAVFVFVFVFVGVTMGEGEVGALIPGCRLGQLYILGVTVGGGDGVKLWNVR